MKKKILSIVLALGLMMGLAMTANAEEYSSTGWAVEYKDGQLTSNFAGGLNAALAGLQPGDKLTVEINVVNSSNEAVDYYMENEAVSMMADATTFGGYTYNLTYGSKTLIGGDVGGEGTNGLSDATKNVDGFFFLGNLAANSSEKVTLVVEFDGESQTNNYQNDRASIEMNFAVEPISKEVITITNPKTGDTNNTGLYTIMTLASGVVLLGLGAWRLVAVRKNREEA